MTRRSSAGAWLFVWGLALVLLPAWQGPEATATRVQAEFEAARQVPGGWTVHAIHGEQRAAPSAHPGLHPIGMPGPARRLVTWAEGYSTAFAWQAKGALARLLALAGWALWLTPVLGAVVLDGLAQRAIKADTFGYQNPAAWALARHAVALAAALPAFVLLWPGVLPAPWGAVCVAAMLMPLRVALAHLQRVFTR